MTESLIQKKSFEFALEIIRLYFDLQNKREYVLSKQLLRSGTSIGANVEEASAAQSRKYFLSKMSIAQYGSVKHFSLSSLFSLCPLRLCGSLKNRTLIKEF